jgi:uncharacterized membrane protein
MISVKGERYMLITDRVWVILVSAVSCAMFMAAMFFFWTPKSYSVIEGVQGRYFLPPYLAMMYCVRNKKFALKENIERPLFFATLLLAGITVWYIMYMVCYASA